MKYTIILPTYKERENIKKIIPLILSVASNLYIKVVDDNSPDGTGKIADEIAKKESRVSVLHRNKKEGLGRAYTAGFNEVLKDPEVSHIIMMDADLSHNPVYLSLMMNKSVEYDVVVGSRYISGGDTIGWEFWRKMLSYFGNIYARVITRVPVSDLTGGFNCIRVSTLKKIPIDTIDSSGYAFQIELKFLLYSIGAKMTEIPIIFKNRVGGESKISNHIISEGILAPWKMLWKKKK